MPSKSSALLKILTTLIAATLIAGCDPFTLTALGVGAGAGVNHQVNGVSYRTFTQSHAKVKAATITALRNMSFKLDGSEKDEKNEIIRASASDRNIEIELEPLSRKTTRMRAVAHVDGSLLVDASTAAEIVHQTEKALARL